jgi:hypothetical protein
VKVGVTVATPAVPVSGVGVQQWMCEAVTTPVSPAKVVCTRMVFSTSSMVTSATPMPPEALGGASDGPVRMAWYTMVTAVAGAAARVNASKAPAGRA